MGNPTGPNPPQDPQTGRVIEVVIGVLVSGNVDSPLVFITRRPSDTVLAGYWEMPGGKIEDGESHAEALRREFVEEVGVEVRVGDALPLIEHVYDHGHVRLYPYRCTHVDGEPRNIQVVEHRWVAPADLRDVRFPPANAPLIEHIITMLA
ncbi:MAG: NUDIX domain-containing protein [Phycisphaera sp.]|nr:NUDIX domain-containing protein [Phycisphaera sp.]